MVTHCVSLKVAFFILTRRVRLGKTSPEADSGSTGLLEIKLVDIFLGKQHDVSE